MRFLQKKRREIQNPLDVHRTIWCFFPCCHFDAPLFASKWLPGQDPAFGGTLPIEIVQVSDATKLERLVNQLSISFSTSTRDQTPSPQIPTEHQHPFRISLIEKSGHGI
jgi:hypothetical protein